MAPGVTGTSIAPTSLCAFAAPRTCIPTSLIVFVSRQTPRWSAPLPLIMGRLGPGCAWSRFAFVVSTFGSFGAAALLLAPSSLASRGSRARCLLPFMSMRLGRRRALCKVQGVVRAAALFVCRSFAIGRCALASRCVGPRLVAAYHRVHWRPARRWLWAVEEAVSYVSERSRIITS